MFANSMVKIRLELLLLGVPTVDKAILTLLTAFLFLPPEKRKTIGSNLGDLAPQADTL